MVLTKYLSCKCIEVGGLLGEPLDLIALTARNIESGLCCWGKNSSAPPQADDLLCRSF